MTLRVGRLFVPESRKLFMNQRVDRVDRVDRVVQHPVNTLTHSPLPQTPHQ